MNFYKRFIGDIQAKTGHLSLAEMGAYDRLLDHYYSTEKRLPADLDACCRIARAMTKDERKAVESVLGQFFTTEADGYAQKRADEMLADAQPKIAANRTNGALGGRPKGSKSKTHKKPNGFPELTQTEPNKNLSQSQSNTNTSVPNGTDGKPSPVPVDNSPPPGLSDADGIWSQGVPFLIAAGVKEVRVRSMLGGLVKSHGTARVWAALQEAIKERPIEPVSWLQAAILKVPGASAPSRKTSHQGFAEIDYTAGVNADGTLA